jgi:hypothetical protein
LADFVVSFLKKPPEQKQKQKQKQKQMYLIATMRSDYLGDCGQFDGLAETVNQSQ